MSTDLPLDGTDASGPPSGSVTRYLAAVQAGDPAALTELWNRYYASLLQQARSKLAGHRIRAADEEDVVTTAFEAFYRAASQGKYPDLSDRHALWRILLTITANKAIDQIRHEKCEVRGAGRVVGESAFGAAVDQSHGGIEQFISEEPSPAVVAIMTENFQERLRRLDDPELKQIALWKLEGYQNQELAEKLSVTERTIERKVALIRKLWTDAEGQDC